MKKRSTQPKVYPRKTIGYRFGLATNIRIVALPVFTVDELRALANLTKAIPWIPNELYNATVSALNKLRPWRMK